MSTVTRSRSTDIPRSRPPFATATDPCTSSAPTAQRPSIKCPSPRRMSCSRRRGFHRAARGAHDGDGLPRGPCSRRDWPAIRRRRSSPMPASTGTCRGSGRSAPISRSSSARSRGTTSGASSTWRPRGPGRPWSWRSPRRSTRKNDLGVKLNYYHRAKVPVYVIADATGEAQTAHRS